MEAKELRIGNLIYEKNNMYENASFEVIEVGLIHLKEIKDDLRDYIVQKPIPLTEEWLLKFGFEDNDIKGYYTNESLNINYDWNNTEGRYYYIDFNKISQLLIKSSQHIKSVHQLQNLYFALTGKEL